MKFDSNRAWTDALYAIRANREVMLALAGVFFLLPTLLSTVFLTDVQTQLMENLNNTEVTERVMQANMGALLGIGLGGAILQIVGYLAVMALLTDSGRPTVGQAIATGLRALPTLLATAILCFLALFLGSLLLSIVLVAGFTAVGAAQAGSAIAVVLLLVLIVYASIKLSLVLPVVVREGQRNPVAAMLRSWRLTRGNSLRLFGFYALLTVAYLVILMIAMLVLGGPVLLLLGQGHVAILVIGVISGSIGAAMSVVLTAIMAQTHRQLAGPSAESLGSTFE